ncbi:MAG TPA: hypothetical protein VGU43_04870 [Thermoplasmata archaeon]|nr:hypothetical protein [Thermoplasmata archaeon]
MPGVSHLTEEDEKAERESRDRLRRADHRLQELRTRRATLIAEIRRLSDEQRGLYDQRAPKEERVEEFHREYQAMGRDLSELRSRRDSLRPRMAALVTELRQMPRPGRDSAGARPEQIRRDVARLELEQQTVALPIAEENALIDRIRALRRELSGAEVAAQGVATEQARRASLEAELRGLHEEAARLSTEFDRLRAARSQRFESVKAQLVSVGEVVGEIREKARLRGELFKTVDEVNRQMVEADREVREALQSSRDRRREAIDTIRSYNRGVRESVSGPQALAQAADQNLEQLLRGGRVRLGG